MWPAAECSALAHREPSGTHPRDRLPILWVSLAQSPSLKVDPTLASTPTKSLTVIKQYGLAEALLRPHPRQVKNSGQGSLLRSASLSLWEGLASTAFTRIGLRHKTSTQTTTTRTSGVLAATCLSTLVVNATSAVSI